MWTLFLLFYTLKGDYVVRDISMHSQTISGFDDRKSCETVSSAFKARPPDPHISVYAVCVEVK